MDVETVATVAGTGYRSFEPHSAVSPSPVGHVSHRTVAGRAWKGLVTWPDSTLHCKLLRADNLWGKIRDSTNKSRPGQPLVLANSLKYRDVQFAFLFGPPRFFSREDASKVHGQVCNELKSDDFMFSYGKSDQATRPEARGFGIQMARPEGKGGFEIRVDYPGMHEPIRLLLGYTWPPSLSAASEELDVAANAVLTGLGGGMTKVMAEARVRAECAVAGNNALGFLSADLLGKVGGWIDGLGKPLEFCSLKFEVAAQHSSDPLKHPKRELLIEVLRDDPSKVYLELMSQWPQLVLAGSEEPELRPIDRKPSEYVKDAREYLERKLQGLSPDGGKSK